MIKLLIRTLFVSLFAVLLSGCYGDLGDDMPVEQNLVVALEPEPESALVRIFSTSYNFNVLIQSLMPRQGVTISVEYRQDSDNSVVFSRNYVTSTSPQPVTITNIPFNEVGTVTVTVTSVTKSDNTVTKTFKLVRK